ncbi:penicillin acylase family protein [Rhizobium johnstonii]|uniref:penicillin acylase family protein n=1 Tax=Rhizobium TaxID=379 RepID=UPI0010323F82|nr:penicillin acylase family protein [Rhizobium leguminosarum]TBF70805.1 penicillin acylase family protein [Rhizobium leguminosarum]TBG93326.1 penicillin acylase family protein [Rhizobium leguminosarum]TBH29941.1 penicillin acylase family protein [Rhizobium leguminosarum]TBH50171.1 penicillin acylase family protein [Rhizobium leguminosarum]TBH59582.1 penicillin acylase family protein [Rhizobium leguminosarum]
MTETIANETISLYGLQSPAEIRVDRWGIAHVKAENEADLFFVQGFNAARDRLWQLDLWRKRGLGLLAADFGPGYLAQDHAARHFLYRGDMNAEWTSYAPDAQAICTAFAAGINAYVALCDAEPTRLPPEFTFFGTEPALWRPEDVVQVRTHALTRNGASEILRANILTLADAETDLLRTRIEPPVDLKVADGVTLADIPLAALRLFKLATAPVTFEPERLAATLADVWTWTEVTDLGDIIRATSEEGSNNWVVHGSRTQTGRPILASDPHRAHAVPSLRYLVHLQAPGFNAIGTGEPTAPGISLGHNGKTAFGLTIFGADQEDVYVYETKEGDPNFYRHRDGWEAILRQDETFAVKGYQDQTLTIAFTRHGPMLYEQPEKRLAIALRSVWLSPGSSAYLGSLSAMRSSSVSAFGSALRSWGTPSVNHVCADVDGNVGWFTAGFTPVRANWHGLLPVPGDGSHEWGGFLPAQDLPHIVNPAAGFFATANEMNLPADRSSDAPSIGHEWAEVSRAERIKSVLAADCAHTTAASMALQTDTYSRPAARICAVLSEVAKRSRLTQGQDAAWAVLKDWDHLLNAESAPAALFEVWWMKHLRPAMFACFAPDPAVRALLAPGDVDTLLALVEAPCSKDDPGPTAARDRMLLDTLDAAFEDCTRRLGPDITQWAWGKLHQALFEHAASRVKREAGDEWNVGPLPMGGSRSTPAHAGYRLSDFRVTAGASVRLVMDVGDWDKSFCINTPGQSGDPRSPHYADLAEDWSKGVYVPLLYSDEKIASETDHRILLLPA